MFYLNSCLLLGKASPECPDRPYGVQSSPKAERLASWENRLLRAPRSKMILYDKANYRQSYSLLLSAPLNQHHPKSLLSGTQSFASWGWGVRCFLDFKGVLTALETGTCFWAVYPSIISLALFWIPAHLKLLDRCKRVGWQVSLQCWHALISPLSLAWLIDI